MNKNPAVKYAFDAWLIEFAVRIIDTAEAPVFRAFLRIRKDIIGNHWTVILFLGVPTRKTGNVLWSSHRHLGVFKKRSNWFKKKIIDLKKTTCLGCLGSWTFGMWYLQKTLLFPGDAIRTRHFF